MLKDEVDPSSFIRRFGDVGIEDVPSVGGKNASLGEMIRELGSKGVAVPDGFAVTAAAFWHFLRASGADRAVDESLRNLDPRDLERLRQAGEAARQAILRAQVPLALERVILEAYERLAAEAGLPGGLDVAVRTSATAEDLPEASFAGQHETFLNVRGATALLQACKRSFASLFTDRAISYRAERGFDHKQIALSIGVQRMVRSDLASSGVMFSLDTESGFRNAVLINASYGLGENIVQGNVTPDEFLVFKPTLDRSPRPILRKLLGTKEMKLVYDVGGSHRVRNVPVPVEDRARFSIEDGEILKLARWACLIEEHYSAKRGEPTPMDMEWAKDGQTGELFVLQARPETVHARRRRDVLEAYRLRAKGRVVATGRSVGERIGVGPVRVMRDATRLQDFRQGEVLIADRTDPDWEPVMKRAAAIVTNRGGRTCHAAIVSRELGLPAIVGAGTATQELRDGQAVTVDCSQGETGYVYDGALAYDVEKIELGGIGQPRTRMMLNVASPDEALALSFLPNDGVGLARIEFIVGNAIGIHPLALLEYERLDDDELRARIDERTAGWSDKSAFFVDRLAEGVAMITAAFWPKDVIVRLSDFKTNEYANLLGGRRYEPAEENPMLGFRGASRYYDPRYREGFALECRAMRKVRDEMGLTNLKLMVPFCRAGRSASAARLRATIPTSPTSSSSRASTASRSTRTRSSRPRCECSRRSARSVWGLRLRDSSSGPGDHGAHGAPLRRRFGAATQQEAVVSSPAGPRTILVATDFSDNAAAALARAGEIASQHGARLVLVHAVLAMTPAAPEFIPVPPSFYEELRALAHEQLEKEVESHRQAGLAVEFLLVAEPAAAGVLAAAAECAADLIVVGTRGTTGWRRLLLGSTAARLVREAPCPVLTVPLSDAARHGPARTALVATDFSEDAALAAQAAARMLGASDPGRRILLLHAYRYPSALSGLEGPALIDAISATRDAAQTELDVLAQKLASPGLEVTTCAEPGDPPEAIIAKAREIGADLIAMGTHGRSGLKRLFLGSTAERVLPSAPCLVLTAHRSPSR